MSRNLVIRLACALGLLVVAPGAAVAVTAQESVYSLAQRCVVVQSPATGKYVERYDDLLGVERYRFNTKNVAGASAST